MVAKVVRVKCLWFKTSVERINEIHDKSLKNYPFWNSNKKSRRKRTDIQKKKKKDYYDLSVSVKRHLVMLNWVPERGQEILPDICR
jgi:hypothetical protein